MSLKSRGARAVTLRDNTGGHGGGRRQPENDQIGGPGSWVWAFVTRERQPGHEHK